MAQITFSDIAIQSQYSEVLSRSDENMSIETKMGKISLKLPVISSNMPQITEWKMAVEMAVNGGMGILHRFMSIENNVDEFDKACGELAVNTGISSPELEYKIGVSVGVKDSEKYRFAALKDSNARVFCIDIAHGHHISMKNMIKWIRENGGKDVVLIAGNVATPEGALDLFSWGADIVKVGIGPGSVCRTRTNTGVGTPQFQALCDIRAAIGDKPIIADGGIKTPGCVPKALIKANAVMVGAVLAGTSETPGDAFPEPGTDLTNRTYYKMYGGSASSENKISNGQSGRFNEGEMKKVPFKGHAKYLLREIEDGIKSAFSYSNALNLKQYQESVKWDLMSGGGKEESKDGK